jgi:hypothetical protein
MSMRTLKEEVVKRGSVRVLVGAALVLAVVLATAVAISAALVPPTLIRPEVYKYAIPELDSLKLGDTVRFFIVVENPEIAPPGYSVVDWHQVRATDIVSSVLEIDTEDSGIVAYLGEEPLMEITDNTVEVTVDLLQPGDYFIFQFLCTVVGPLETGMDIVNRAAVDYEDSEGNQEETIYSDPVIIPVDYYPLVLSLIMRNGYLCDSCP